MEEVEEVLVAGQPLAKLPADLYIPPAAMRVFLTSFEGPLDLLLYLIKRHNLDILEIPVFEVTKQYVEYIELMQTLQIDLAADYLEMAAILTEIKSRMLLPRPKQAPEEEEDPRAVLIRRLQAYEQIKEAAATLAECPRLERDVFLGRVGLPEQFAAPVVYTEVSFSEILASLQQVMTRVELNKAHDVDAELLTVQDKMTLVLSEVKKHKEKFVEFAKFVYKREGRLGVVVAFLALLEMAKEQILELVQAELYAPIYVRLTKW